MAENEKPEKCNNIIGHTRTIQTAIHVVQYLKDRLAVPHTNILRDQITYRFKQPTTDNGWWCADIIVETWNGQLSLDDSKLFVDTCRAFVSGAGEIWA